MPSDRVQRRIERLLDEAEQAMDGRDWDQARALAQDVLNLDPGGAVRIFTILPSHNPIGPFDFSGGFDDRSDRRQPLLELMNRGYEDAYHQFIEPVVGASGEHM